jgi:hypothetical protein
MYSRYGLDNKFVPQFFKINLDLGNIWLVINMTMIKFRQQITKIFINFIKGGVIASCVSKYEFPGTHDVYISGCVHNHELGGDEYGKMNNSTICLSVKAKQ